LAIHSISSRGSGGGSNSGRPHVQRRSVAASDDTRRIEMKCAFPGSDSYALLFLLLSTSHRKLNIAKQTTVFGGGLDTLNAF